MFELARDPRHLGADIGFLGVLHTWEQAMEPSHVHYTVPAGGLMARFHRSSYAIGLKEKIRNETQAQSQGLPLADYATHGGSVPLNVAGAGIVGSVTVSGLPQREDHELAIEALCALLRRDVQRCAFRLNNITHQAFCNKVPKTVRESADHSS